jgi:hypothetical protein
MAVVNQLNLNVGTEQNPNFVLHDINDKRISTTAVTTATHLLTCNSGVTSIAPITAANLASVLGVSDFFNLFTGRGNRITANSDLNDIIRPGAYFIQTHDDATTISNRPNTMAAVVLVFCAFTSSSSWSYG